MRAALTMVRGMDIVVEPSRRHLVLSVFSAVPFFRSKEKFPLDGSWARQRRRDMRGEMQGGITVIRGSLQVVTRWGEPHPGGSRDVFTLLSPHDLLW